MPPKLSLSSKRSRKSNASESTKKQPKLAEFFSGSSTSNRLPALAPGTAITTGSNGVTRKAKKFQGLSDDDDSPGPKPILRRASSGRARKLMTSDTGLFHEQQIVGVLLPIRLSVS
eukprot:TRINITY_DN5186_c0_g1_i1.p1 TRINITY_DN5186_c0_g1~~TRINITY_DN5186_c0_g1_i1.p1  ORF type:complete len:116 (+),score=0.83 TRINITY_DN5186_c0_g1_i1:49-396(+)